MTKPTTISQLDPSVLARLPSQWHERLAVGMLDANGQVTAAAAGLLTAVRTSGQPWLEVRRWWTGHVEAADDALVPSEVRHPAGPLVLALPELAVELAAMAPAPEPVPGAAVRLWTELLGNALGHRDWNRPEDVLLDITTDRIRLWSPGTAPSGVVVEGGKVVGRRSPHAHAMAILGALGLSHQQGRGWACIPDLGASLGYRVQAYGRADAFEVHVLVDPLRAVPRTPSSSDARRVRVPASVTDGAVVRYLRRVGVATARELQEALGRPNSTIRAALRRLEKAGVVRSLEAARRSRLQTYALVGD